MKKEFIQELIVGNTLFVVDDIKKWESIQDCHVGLCKRLVFNFKNMSEEESEKIINRYIEKHRYAPRMDFYRDATMEQIKNDYNHICNNIRVFKNYSYLNHFCKWEIHEEGQELLKKEPKLEN